MKFLLRQTTLQKYRQKQTGHNLYPPLSRHCKSCGYELYSILAAARLKGVLPMTRKKELSVSFNTRQYMETPDYELFYYKDVSLEHVSFHRHEYYEFYFFLEGSVDYQIRESTYPLKFGDFLLLPPGIPHRPLLRNTHTPYRRFVLWLGKDFYDRLAAQSQDLVYGFQTAATGGPCCFHTADHISRELQGHLIDLLEEIGNKTSFFHETSVRMMIASLLLTISRLVYDSLHQISPAYENALYLNLCSYISSHLQEDLTLEKLAAFFFVSKYHISHIFKENMGISLHQYIVKKRLEASKNGLLSGLPFNQIIDQYGFHDYTSFYRAFKKEFGLSPTEYREQKQPPSDKHNLDQYHITYGSDSDT